MSGYLRDFWRVNRECPAESFSASRKEKGQKKAWVGWIEGV